MIILIKDIFIEQIYLKIFNEVFKNQKIRKSRNKKILFKFVKKGFFGQDLRIRAKLKNKPELISKKKLIKKFKWNNDKKIAVFFFNHLIDVITQDQEKYSKIIILGVIIS